MVFSFSTGVGLRVVFFGFKSVFVIVFVLVFERVGTLPVLVGEAGDMGHTPLRDREILHTSLQGVTAP